MEGQEKGNFIVRILRALLSHVYVLIIAGGQGTRLFPLSHDGCPKQFCHIDKNRTFIQATIKRFIDLGIKPQHVIIIVTNDNQLRLAKKQCIPLGIISENILKIDPGYGYAGAMIKGAEFIKELDEEAVIINTPADQYIVPDESFNEAINNALESAQAGNPTILGVKVNDLVTFTGCGHALYHAPDNEDDEQPTYTVHGFVEKPDKDYATMLMRKGCSACNTGINVWSVSTILGIDVDPMGLGTDTLMDKLKENSRLQVAIGTFPWYDCGTLKSLYDISAKTPNHENANLGKGIIERTDCRDSLFYSIEGVTLRATNIRDTAIIINNIDDRIVIAVVELSDSQKVKELAEKYKEHKELLVNDFAVSARNNEIMRSDYSGEIRVGFVGVDGCIVYSHKNPDGTIEIAISKQ